MARSRAPRNRQVNAISVTKAGLKMGYQDAQFALGSTNVGPTVLALKQAGVDAVSLLLQQNTGFAIINGLREQGVQLKAPVLYAGYGRDLLTAGAAALANAQGSYFTITYEPIEMQTAATKRFSNALKTYGGTTVTPGLNEYLDYTAVDAFVVGLKAAGSDPTQAQFIDALLGVTDYTAAGLFGSHTISFALKDRGVNGGAGADNCQWFVQFRGSTFHLVPGADPVCGTVIPGEESWPVDRLQVLIDRSASRSGRPPL